MSENIKATPKPTCFVIMPISDVHGYDSGHFARVYEHILKPAILIAGFNPIRADDEIKTDYIVVGIIQKIVESEMVICDFSARNPNVMYELGIRHAFNKPVTLIKDRRTEKVFDIQGLRYIDYDESLRIDSVQKDIAKIAAAIVETAKAGTEGMNSVVKLAGLNAAEIPIIEKVSADTQLVLSAISSLERRVEGIENSEPRKLKYIRYEEDMALFLDGSNARIGDVVFDNNNNSLGIFVGRRVTDDAIVLQNSEGLRHAYLINSKEAKGMNSLPF